MENTPIDLAYTAGFFDGEGSISILKRKKKDWNVNHFLRVSIGQKDAATLDWMVDRFGGNVYLVKRDGSYVWALSDKKAYLFIKEIMDFLKYKKPQAELAMKFQEERMEANRGKNKRFGLSKEELTCREMMFLEMKELKKIFTKSSYNDSVAGSTTKRDNNES